MQPACVRTLVVPVIRQILQGLCRGREHHGFHKRQNLPEPDFTLRGEGGHGFCGDGTKLVKGRYGGGNDVGLRGEPGDNGPSIHMFLTCPGQGDSAKTTVMRLGDKLCLIVQQQEIR